MTAQAAARVISNGRPAWIRRIACTTRGARRGSRTGLRHSEYWTVWPAPTQGITAAEPWRRGTLGYRKCVPMVAPPRPGVPTTAEPATNRTAQAPPKIDVQKLNVYYGE